MRLPVSAQNYFGEGFTHAQVGDPFYASSCVSDDHQNQKPVMSMESDQEMLHFVDDPTLFEFNECNNEFADLDRYESAPVPLDWQQYSAQQYLPEVQMPVEQRADNVPIKNDDDR